MGLSYFSPVRPFHSSLFPSSDTWTAPSTPSALSRRKICWIVGCLPASSSSSQWAPSNTGVDTHTAGSVRGRVLVSVPRSGTVATSPAPVPSPAGGVAQMGLEHLADVHPAGHAQRVQDDVDRGAVGQEGHVLDGQDLRDDALVAVASGELVALGDLALLGHVHPDQLLHAGRQLVGVVPGEHPDVDDRARLTVGNLERGVAHLPGLLTEDGPQEALLGGLLGLALGGDLAHQHVAGTRPRPRCG